MTAEFVEAARWAGEPGVRRGEWYGAARLGHPFNMGYVDRVVVEAKPTGDSAGGEFRLDRLGVPDPDNDFRQGVKSALATARALLAEHQATANLVASEGWAVRVWWGGWPWPVDDNEATFLWEDHLADHGMSGGSLGLAVALATVDALVPGWLRTTARRDLVVTGICEEPDPDAVLTGVDHYDAKSEAASTLGLALLYPEGQSGAPPNTGVATFGKAFKQAFPLAGLDPEPIKEKERLSDDQWLDRWFTPEGSVDRLPLAEAVREHHMDLVGDGGAGKTMALVDLYRRVFQGQLEDELPEPWVPVFIDLADSHSGQDLDDVASLLDLIETRDVSLGSVASDDLKDAANDRGLLFLIDGSDRLTPLGQRRLAGLLRPEAVATDTANRFRIVVARRPSPETNIDQALTATDPATGERIWQQGYLLPVSFEQAQGYLTDLGASETVVQQLLTAVGADQANDTAGLAGNAMVLRLLGILALDGTALPAHATRGQVYQKALNLWLDNEHWQPPDEWTWWPEERTPATRRILQNLAYHIISSGQSLPRTELRDEIVSPRLPAANMDITPQGYIDSYLEHCPILIPTIRQGVIHIRFIHDTITEYLAAEHHLAQGMTPPLEPRWESVLTFVSALDHVVAASIVAGLLGDVRPSAWQYLAAASCAAATSSDQLAGTMVDRLISELTPTPVEESRLTFGHSILTGFVLPSGAPVGENWPVEVIRLLGREERAARAIVDHLGGIVPQLRDKLHASFRRVEQLRTDRAMEMRSGHEGWLARLQWSQFERSLRELTDKYRELLSKLCPRTEANGGPHGVPDNDPWATAESLFKELLQEESPHDIVPGRLPDEPNRQSSEFVGPATPRRGDPSVSPDSAARLRSDRRSGPAVQREGQQAAKDHAAGGDPSSELPRDIKAPHWLVSSIHPDAGIEPVSLWSRWFLKSEADWRRRSDREQAAAAARALLLQSWPGEINVLPLGVLARYAGSTVAADNEGWATDCVSTARALLNLRTLDELRWNFTIERAVESFGLGREDSEALEAACVWWLRFFSIADSENRGIVPKETLAGHLQHLETSITSLRGFGERRAVEIVNAVAPHLAAEGKSRSLLGQLFGPQSDRGPTNLRIHLGTSPADVFAQIASWFMNQQENQRHHEWPPPQRADFELDDGLLRGLVWDGNQLLRGTPGFPPWLGELLTAQLSTYGAVHPGLRKGLLDLLLHTGQDASLSTVRAWSRKSTGDPAEKTLRRCAGLGTGELSPDDRSFLALATLPLARPELLRHPLTGLHERIRPLAAWLLLQEEQSGDETGLLWLANAPDKLPLPLQLQLTAHVFGDVMRQWTIETLVRRLSSEEAEVTRFPEAIEPRTSAAGLPPSLILQITRGTAHLEDELAVEVAEHVVRSLNSHDRRKTARLAEAKLAETRGSYELLQRLIRFIESLDDPGGIRNAMD